MSRFKVHDVRSAARASYQLLVPQWVGVPCAASFEFISSASTLVQHPECTGPPAFVFDIDGVLIRGDTVLNPAQRALQQLYHHGKVPRYPICFLTNGGGVTEAMKAQQLSDWLGVQIKADQVVLSHTPFRSLVGRLGQSPVLAVGRGMVAEVAFDYGFTKVVTTGQIAAATPSAVPFAPPDTPSDGGGPCLIRDEGFGSKAHPISAVLVFHDPANWYHDLQILTDVLVSGGVLGDHGTDPNLVIPELHFSNPDILWANEHPAPRLGQGAFAAALEAVYCKVSGRAHLPKVVYGKPTAEPYRLVQRLLEDQRRLLWPSSHGQPITAPGPIYAIGDNPQSDVAGANAAGPPWVSVLVRTGVFQGVTANDEQHPAHLVVDDVEAAVEAALHRERSARWHSMR